MYLIAALFSVTQSLRALIDSAVVGREEAVAGAEDSRAGLVIKPETYVQSF